MRRSGVSGFYGKKLRIFTHVGKFSRLSPNWDIGGAAEYQVSITESYEFSLMLYNFVTNWHIGGAA